MSIPTFSDLGKKCRDLFNKGYNYGFGKLDLKTRPNDSLEVKTTASHNISTQRLFGSTELKYDIPDWKLVVTEKWNTDNVLASELKFTDLLFKGSKVTFDSSFWPATGKRLVKAKTEATRDNLKVNGDLTVYGGDPRLTTSFVVGNLYRTGWLFGAQGVFDLNEAKMTQSDFAFVIPQKNYEVHLHSKNGIEFGGTIYHEVHGKFTWGTTFGWDQAQQTTSYGVAAKYKVDRDWTLQGKVLSIGQGCVSTQHKLNEHVKMTLSGMVNMANFQEGNHKIGIGFEYEPCC